MKHALSVFLLLFVLSGFTQSLNPDADEIFREDEVTEIRLTMSAADKEFLLADENRFSETYVQANVEFNNSQLPGTTVTNVGVRLRGNTARNGAKRSFKIDFKEFGGERFESYKKLNLKPNVNDPAHIRELLSMHMFRLLDVPAPRIAPTTLYINDEYMGVYLNVEQIDDEFVDKRFGKESGFLYKCAYSATLEDNGQVFNDELYEPKMNEEFDTKAELDHFVDVLNNTSDSQFQTEIEKVFQVDRFIRYMAVEAIIGHWDGYSYLNNNYYLYYDADAGDHKFEFIAYDTDNTWGIDWVDRDWATRDLTHFYRHNHARPLASRIMDVEEYRNRYYGYLHRLFTNYFTPAYLYPIFDQLETMLSPLVQADHRFDDSFGFTHSDFLAAFDYSSNRQAEYGLRGFVETRRSTGIGSFPTIILNASISDDFKIYPNPNSTGILTITGKNISQLPISITDVFGREMIVQILQNAGKTARIKAPKISGMYILQIGESTSRIIVK